MAYTDAAGPAAGFLYQFERLLYHLASRDSEVVIGIEAGDDLVIQDSDGVTLEEDKHSVQPTGHPLADRSVALWKTLANWVDAGKDARYHKAGLFLVTNRPVPACLARRLGHQPKQPKDSVLLVADLRRVASSPSKAIAPFVDRVISANDDTLANLIGRITLFDASEGTSSSALREKIASHLHIPDHIDSGAVLDRLLGWLHAVVKDRWDRGLQVWIEGQAFSRQLFSTLKSIDRQRVLERATHLINISEEDRKKARLNHFFHHLSLISCGDDEVEEALDDFVRFNVEYSRLLEEGDIGPDDWEARRGRLQRRWRAIRRRHIDVRSDSPSEDVGRDIYRETVNHIESLGVFTTYEQYLTAGHYQRLANVDEVWWSPDYLDHVALRGVDVKSDS